MGLALMSRVEEWVFKLLVLFIYGLVVLFVTMLLTLSSILWNIPFFGPIMSIALVGLLFLWLDKVKYPPQPAPILTWKETRDRFMWGYYKPHRPRRVEDMPASFEDMFPETLYQAGCMMRKKQVCLACGSCPATSVLRSTQREIVPLCEGCTKDWNFYGYAILERLKPKQLVLNVLKYKLRHWFSTQSIYRCYKDLMLFKAWGVRTKKIMRRLKRNDD